VPSCPVSCFLALVAPWEVRNFKVLHHWVPIRSNFWAEFGWETALMPTAVGCFWLQPHGRIPRKPPVQSVGRDAVRRRAETEALDWVRTHPKRFAQITARRVLIFWAGVTTFGNGRELRHPRLESAAFFTFSALSWVGASCSYANACGSIPVLHSARGLPDDLLSFFPSRAITVIRSSADDAVGGLSFSEAWRSKEDRDRGMTLSIITLLHERNTIQNVVDTVLSVPLLDRAQVVIVERLFQDGTRDILSGFESKVRQQVRVLMHDKKIAARVSIGQVWARSLGDKSFWPGRRP